MDIRNIQYQLRQRRLDEIFDFAFLVLRRYAGRFMRVYLIAIAVCLPINFAYLFWHQYARESKDFFSYWHLGIILLLFIERSIITVPLVLLNGNLLFDHKPAFRDLLKDMPRILPRFIWQQAIVRPIYIFLLFWTFIAPWRSLVVHFFKSEVYLLERLQKGAHVRQRLSALTSGQSERTVGFLLIDLILMFIFILAASFSWQFLLELFNVHKLYWWLDAGSLFKGSLLYAPITHVLLFIYFIYHSVAKFLYYIDTRSLREGWDVELALVRGVRETEEAA